MSLIFSPSSVVPGRKRPGLYVGGKAEAKNRALLQRWGVTHILNVTPEKEANVQSGVPNFFETSGCFKYKRVPVYDSATSDLASFADEVVTFISSGLHHGSVLVHCQKGASRSVTCVAFYLLRKVGMTVDNAIELIRSKRPEASPIPSFFNQLRQYETKCRRIGAIKDQPSTSESASETRPSGGPVKPLVGPFRPPYDVPKITATDAKPSIGPLKPPHNASIGPLPPPNGPPATPPPLKKGLTIGPLLPADAKDKKDTIVAIGHVLLSKPTMNESEERLFGPTLPSTVTSKKVAAASIGMSLPPEASTEAKLDSLIGPSLPPTAARPANESHVNGDDARKRCRAPQPSDDGSKLLAGGTRLAKSRRTVKNPSRLS